MVLRARSLELVAIRDELLAVSRRVRDDLLGVRLPRRLARLQERGRDTGDRVVVRAALARGEDGVVDALLEVGSLLRVLAEEDETSTGTTQGLVAKDRCVSKYNQSCLTRHDLRGSGDNITVVEGARVLATGNETANVSHVGHQVSTMLVSDLAKSLVVPVAGVRRGTADDETGLEEASLVRKFAVVN